jgi:SOS-response transcriptional repressor LexA
MTDELYLTPREGDLIQAIRELRDKNGRGATLNELRIALGLTSTGSVRTHLLSLELKGLVKRPFGRHRAIKLTGAAA